jgi:hypothetical protein
VNFTYFVSDQFSFNKIGQTGFRGGLTGSSAISTNNQGVWAGEAGSLALVARRGDQAPNLPDGTVFGGGFFTFGVPGLNSGGQTAFYGELADAGVASTNNSGIWLGTPGNQSLVVRN